MNRVDTLLRYILLVAGQEDPGNRELGPIHELSSASLRNWPPARREEWNDGVMEYWVFIFSA
jgi:hypothetical protein